MKIEEFLNTVSIAVRIHPEWRLGQTMFNVLCDKEPKVARLINGADIDPYNDDRRIPLFLMSMIDYWSEHE